MRQGNNIVEPAPSRRLKASITACVHELPAARSDANNAIVPPAVTTRARHLSDTNDEYYTAATASPSADFTLLAECRRRLTRPERQTRTTRSTSPISGHTPFPTSNRFSMLSDDYQSTEVPGNPQSREVGAFSPQGYVGKFDPETSEVGVRSYVKRHVVLDETDIAYVKKLRSQSHLAPSSCFFCVVVGSSAARRGLKHYSRSHAGPVMSQCACSSRLFPRAPGPGCRNQA